MASSLYKKILFSAVLFFASISQQVSAVAFCNPLSGDCTGADGNNLETLIGNLMNFVFGIALVVCPALIVWGGFLYATGGDSEDKRKKGKQIITYAIVGLVIIAISNVIKTVIIDIANS